MASKKQAQVVPAKQKKEKVDTEQLFKDVKRLFKEKAKIEEIQGKSIVGLANMAIAYKEFFGKLPEVDEVKRLTEYFVEIYPDSVEALESFELPDITFEEGKEYPVVDPFAQVFAELSEVETLWDIFLNAQKFRAAQPYAQQFQQLFVNIVLEQEGWPIFGG